MKGLSLSEANYAAAVGEARQLKTVTRRVRKPGQKPPYVPGETVALTLPHWRNGRFVWDSVSAQFRGRDEGDNKFYGRRGDLISPLAEWTHCPAFLMPVWACLHFAEILSRRPEVLGDVTDEDAVLEGCYRSDAYNWAPPEEPGSRYARPREAYVAEWDALNARRGYPWREELGVWRIEFRLKEKE